MEVGPASLLLAIETAGSGCSAAILRDGEVLAAECRAIRYGHAEALLPMVDRVARAACVEPGDLRLVAVATGPGGFTGIRAGLAAAQGIALGTGALLVGVTSFAAVAAAVRVRGLGCRAAPLLVALDSRRDDLYVQLFAANCATPLAEPASLLPDRLASHVAGPVGCTKLLIAGDRAELAAEALGRERRVGLVPDSAPDALGVAAAALLALEAGAVPGITVSAPVRPLYLRPPDVTLPKGKRLGPVAVQ
ncbi:MAG: tRNA (adenosine(37)-N6)-threonylcarbamoyltransferase complex dimerization subunit type 1 TsaB [Alphaproteobacteria bacterium]